MSDSSNKIENNILSDLGPLYHTYSFFGVNNDQLPGIYELNQQAKAPIITAYIAYAIAKSEKNTTDGVSLITNSKYYYESPAPGWTWGNRYSRASFDKMIRKICPKIVDQHFNELEGNNRLDDRGSVYYLIEK